MDNYEPLDSRLASATEAVIRLEAERDAFSQRIDKLSGWISTHEKESIDLGEGIALVQKFSTSIQTGIIAQFEDLMTRGVREIFGRDYSIKVEFEAKANSMYADFYAILPNGKTVHLESGEGGGLRDLVGVLKRILYLVLDPTQPARLLILDESFKALDSGRSPKGFRFIMTVLRELKIQVIWVTHFAGARQLQGDGVRILDFVLENDVTSVTELKGEG